MHEFQVTDPRIINRWTPGYLNFLQEGLVKYKKEEAEAHRKAARRAKRKRR